MRHMPKLIVTEKGGSKEKVYEFATDGVSIGRSTDNAVRLENKQISRKHALIVVAGGSFFLTDLGSGNGTYLNGSKVAPNEKSLLRHGDMISIENYNLSFSQIDEMLASSFNEITDSDILEVKLLKKVLRAIDKESIPSIEVLNGNFVGKKFFLTEDMPEVVLGRDESADYEIREYVISRQHARLVRQDGRVFIHDMSSKNGTYVNNRRVTETELHDGDRIALGTIVLIFRNPKEVNMEEIRASVKKPLPPVAKKPLVSEEQTMQDEGAEEIAEVPETTPDDYPIPQPKHERITLSGFELGMIGFGVLIFIFAIISFVNLVMK